MMLLILEDVKNIVYQFGNQPLAAGALSANLEETKSDPSNPVHVIKLQRYSVKLSVLC